MTDNQGNESYYNYESTLSDNSVIAALQADGGYTKKVQVNTDTNKPAVWKCTEAGTNCKVSIISFNEHWLADNPQYMFIPSTETITSTEIDNADVDKRVIVTTASGNKFGIQFN